MVNTDKSSYTPGQAVTAVSGLENGGPVAWLAADDLVVVAGADGAVVFECYIEHATRLAGTASSLAAGAAVTDNCEWDQRDARSRTSGRAAPGTYTVTGR
jgi:hypothetical protein